MKLQRNCLFEKNKKKLLFETEIFFWKKTFSEEKIFEKIFSPLAPKRPRHLNMLHLKVVDR